MASQATEVPEPTAPPASIMANSTQPPKQPGRWYLIWQLPMSIFSNIVYILAFWAFLVMVLTSLYALVYRPDRDRLEDIPLFDHWHYWLNVKIISVLTTLTAAVGVWRYFFPSRYNDRSIVDLMLFITGVSAVRKIVNRIHLYFVHETPLDLSLYVQQLQGSEEVVRQLVGLLDWSKFRPGHGSSQLEIIQANLIPYLNNIFLNEKCCKELLRSLRLHTPNTSTLYDDKDKNKSGKLTHNLLVAMLVCCLSNASLEEFLSPHEQKALELILINLVLLEVQSRRQEASELEKSGESAGALSHPTTAATQSVPQQAEKSQTILDCLAELVIQIRCEWTGAVRLREGIAEPAALPEDVQQSEIVVSTTTPPETEPQPSVVETTTPSSTQQHSTTGESGDLPGAESQSATAKIIILPSDGLHSQTTTTATSSECKHGHEISEASDLSEPGNHAGVEEQDDLSANQDNCNIVETASEPQFEYDPETSVTFRASNVEQSAEIAPTFNSPCFPPESTETVYTSPIECASGPAAGAVAASLPNTKTPETVYSSSVRGGYGIARTASPPQPEHGSEVLEDRSPSNTSPQPRPIDESHTKSSSSSPSQTDRGDVVGTHAIGNIASERNADSSHNVGSYGSPGITITQSPEGTMVEGTPMPVLEAASSAEAVETSTIRQAPQHGQTKHTNTDDAPDQRLNADDHRTVDKLGMPFDQRRNVTLTYNLIRYGPSMRSLGLIPRGTADAAPDRRNLSDGPSRRVNTCSPDDIDATADRPVADGEPIQNATALSDEDDNAVVDRPHTDVLLARRGNALLVDDMTTVPKRPTSRHEIACDAIMPAKQVLKRKRPVGEEVVNIRICESMSDRKPIRYVTAFRAETASAATELPMPKDTSVQNVRALPAEAENRTAYHPTTADMSLLVENAANDNDNGDEQPHPTAEMYESLQDLRSWAARTQILDDESSFSTDEFYQYWWY